VDVNQGKMVEAFVGPADTSIFNDFVEKVDRFGGFPPYAYPRLAVGFGFRPEQR